MKNVLQAIIFKSNNHKDVKIKVNTSPYIVFDNLIKQAKEISPDYEIYKSTDNSQETLFLYEYSTARIDYDKFYKINIQINRDEIDKIDLQIDNKLINLKDIYLLYNMTLTDNREIVRLDVEKHKLPIKVRNLRASFFYYTGKFAENNFYIHLKYYYKRENKQ